MNSSWKINLKKLLATLLLISIGSGCRQETAAPIPPAPQQIQRIVALSPSLSEAVFALGLGDRVVGVTAFADYPPAVLALPKVGGYSEINTEAVYALKPDLVIGLEQQDTTTKRLQALGLPTLSFTNDSLAQIIDMFRRLGKHLGRQERAEILINEIESTKTLLVDKTRDRPRHKVLVSVGRNMGTGEIGDVYVAGRNTIYGEVIEIVGGVNAYAGPMPYVALGREAILRLNPDVILDLIPNLEQMPSHSKRDALDQWQVFDRVEAVINSRITICTANYICVPGPRVAMMMRDVAQAIHPNIRFNDE